MEVNVYGPMRLIRAALPGMRKQQSGTIVNISSLAGFEGVPAVGIYSLSKFAMEGFTESLAGEVKEHNIDVLLVEPGSYRTNFLGAYKTATPKQLDQYTKAKAVVDRFSTRQGKQPGDPEKGAARMLEAISGTGEAGHLKGKVLRVVLGPDCVGRFEAKVKSMQDDLDACREIAMSTDLIE